MMSFIQSSDVTFHLYVFNLPPKRSFAVNSKWSIDEEKQKDKRKSYLMNYKLI